ncbi:EbsA family protein [Vagococcus coleopterorum]|uniref:EbsA family protein n=1 Tax=Vagococcus coleopterorum TaxID=2714946 RepID=A0A6G8AN36_9ENTE|nr:EbsA family protein [Vagococcus coleopterorum]QIL46491.1 EbsA family protein [Vagococcus coleopterorum]
MKEKLIKKAYRWQPEIATSLIYWSLTFTLFFIALIVQLELIKLNIYSILIGLVFIFFVWLGLRRIIVIEDNDLIIKTILKKNERKIPVQSIKELSVGTYGLTIEQELLNESLLMTPKTLDMFIRDVKAHEQFKGIVKGI